MSINLGVSRRPGLPVKDENIEDLLETVCTQDDPSKVRRAVVLLTRSIPLVRYPDQPVHSSLEITQFAQSSFLSLTSKDSPGLEGRVDEDGMKSER